MEHIIILFTSLSALCVGLKQNPVKSTLYGNVRGKITSRLPGKAVEEYLGVPYAAPPVGQLRFKRPQKPTPWQNILDTTSIPSACPQMDWYYQNSHTPFFNKSSENCLFMNIFVPMVKGKALPVLLYVHGGSNRVGMGAMFDGDILAAHGQIVVVNFNYRLGVLGFYADRSEGIEGNNGLLDQVQAMQWVQDNIEFFNGDPSKVTIHGHSAGAGDVGLHLISELTKGMFRYAIIHSGSPLAYWAVSDCVETWRKPTLPSDCEPGSTYRKPLYTYEELMLKPVNDTSFLNHRGEITPYNLVTFLPVKDDYYLKKSPDQQLKCTKVHANSVLLAVARDEGFPFYVDVAVNDNYDFMRRFLPSFSRLFNDNFTVFVDEVMNVYEDWKQRNISRYPHHTHLESDVIFYIPMVKLADLISRWMDQVYLFSFDYVSENLTGPTWQGVPHGWDLFYVFGAPLVGHPKHSYTKRDIIVSKTAMTLFSNYVKYGYLTLDGKHRLSSYNSAEKTFNKLDFRSGQPVVSQEKDFRKPRVEFWYKHLFPNDPFTCNSSESLRCTLYLWFMCLIIMCLYHRLY